MDDEMRQKREAALFEAAYILLAQYGYGGTSMLRIAKAAKASNETLYRWYGHKDGLFKAMAQANAAVVREVLTEALAGGDEPWAALSRFAPVFLRMITSDQVVLLNRAAAADPSGTLGASISAGGRHEIMPLLQELMQRLCSGTTHAPEEVAHWFVSLLIGDWQIKRVIHDAEPFSDADIQTRCERTLALLRRLVEG